MAFEYYQVEDELVAILTQKITESGLNAEAVVYPDSDDDYKRAVEKARITVGFLEAVSGENKTTNQQVTSESLTVMCLIQSRKKRGTDGCHHIAGLLKVWLAGIQTTHCGRLMYKSYKGSEQVYDSDNGIWSWVVEFTCSKLFVQTIIDEDPEGPSLQQVILNDQFQ